MGSKASVEFLKDVTGQRGEEIVDPSIFTILSEVENHNYGSSKREKLVLLP